MSVQVLIAPRFVKQRRQLQLVEVTVLCYSYDGVSIPHYQPIMYLPTRKVERNY